MNKLPRITGKEAVSALKKAGFMQIRMRGSHCYLYHEEKDKIVTIPVHRGKILAPKTLKSILNQADITIDEFKELI